MSEWKSWNFRLYLLVVVMCYFVLLLWVSVGFGRLLWRFSAVLSFYDSAILVSCQKVFQRGGGGVSQQKYRRPTHSMVLEVELPKQV